MEANLRMVELLLLNDSSSAAARILHPLVRRSSIAVVRHCQKLTHQLENLNGKLFGMCKPCHALNRAVSMDQIVKIERRVATEPAALISWMLDDKRCRRVKVAQSCAGPAGCSWPYRHSLRSCCRRESGKELPRAEARARSSEPIPRPISRDVPERRKGDTSTLLKWDISTLRCGFRPKCAFDRRPA